MFIVVVLLLIYDECLVCNTALSILEKLHVPLGWWSSGFKANENTNISLESWEHLDCGFCVLARIVKVISSAVTES